MLVFTDLETSGLDPQNDSVLEIAAIITDDALNEVARFERVLYFDRAHHLAELAASAWWQDATDEAKKAVAKHPGNRVTPYVIDTHHKNGLWAACVYGQALDTVDRDFARFIETAHRNEEFVDEKTGETKTRLVKPQLAGSTISFDRGFIAAHLPRSLDALHYRNVDVSSFNETAKRFWPKLYETRPTAGKDFAHRGMADILESIGVYRHYLGGLARAADAAGAAL